MTMPAQHVSDSPIERLYLWGSRYAGAVLLIGIVFHVVEVLSGTTNGIITDITAIWPKVALVSLAAVPVVALAVAGSTWIFRDRRDVAGWMAVATALFLSLLWVIK